MVGYFRKNEKVIASEAFGRFPLVTVFVKTAECDVVANTALRVVFPDGGLYGPQPDLMCRFVFWHVFLSLWPLPLFGAC